MPRLRLNKYKVKADNGPSKEVTGLNNAFAAIRHYIDAGYSTIDTYRRTLYGWKLHRTDTSTGVGRVPTVKRPNPVSTLIGKWIPAHAVKILPDGRVQILKEKNPRSNPLSISKLMGMSRSQLLALKRKWEKVDERNGESIDRWEKVTGYDNQRDSAIRVLQKERDAAQDNLRQIKSWLSY